MANVYYDPQEFDLEIVASATQENMSYEFNYFVVWRHKQGDIFYASDSGCSCPTPFEDFHSLDDLTKLDSFSQLKYEVEDWAGDKDHTCVP